MDYLNQDDAILRRSEEKRIFAVAELLKVSLECSHSYRMQFDGMRLSHVIGREKMDNLASGVLIEEKHVGHQYDVHADIIDSSKLGILRDILNPTVSKGYAERPLNYIKSVRCLNDEGRTILRLGDHGNTILFMLPENVRASLLNTFRDHGIPETVVQQVDVDVEGLEP
jgi:hypothetical protein